MALDQDLERLGLQEERLQFDAFDAAKAWELGCRMRDVALARGYKIAIDIRQTGLPLFFTALPGATPNNAEWLRRKRNVVEHFHRSSYAMCLSMEKRGSTLTERFGVSNADFVAAGGCFPIRVRGTGVVGSIGVSGLIARDDHGFIIEMLAEVLSLPWAELALSAE